MLNKMNWDEYKNKLVVHHWDTDGVCSAALLKDYIGAQKFMTPTIGNYYLTDKEILRIKEEKPDLIVIADMALPKENIIRLMEVAGVPVVMFDHHHQDKIEEIMHVNPGIGHYSAGWVINEYFEKEQNILSVLGAIGDKETAVKADNDVQNVLSAAGITFEEATRIVELIDSNYILMDKEKVSKAVEIIYNNKEKIKKLLDNEIFLDNVKQIEAEYNSQLGKESEEKDNLLIHKIHTDLNLISKITRKISADNPKKVVLIINDKPELTNIYLRRKNYPIDLRELIEIFKEWGLNVGGKKEVLGAYVPKDMVGEVVNKIEKVIG